MTNITGIWKTLDRRIRASLAYTNWVNRNKGPLCLKCGSNENLECHHLVQLYHVILGLWNFYGDPEEVFKHVVMYHEHDMLEGVTLCAECHKTKHPGRSMIVQSNQINTESWCVIPRMLQIEPNHSKIERDGAIGLIAYQTLLGIGWNVMNGHVDTKILTIHRRRFAELIGKTPGTSFNTSLEDSLQQLMGIEILDGYHPTGNDIELHLSKKYLGLLLANPWFVPLKDIPTNSMCVLCLRLWLGMQTRRHLYSISLEKLQPHIGMTIKSKSRAIKAIQKALKHIPWAKMEDKESLQFTLTSRQPTPIRSLRAILMDSLDQAQ
jgi:hypothetical protein